METKQAVINRQKEKTSRIIKMQSKDIEIILTDDNPNNIKAAFNELLQELKESYFNFELDDQKEDLYFHICKEYISQLNSEINSVRSEMIDYGLIEEE